jgi:hypothetical protein
MTASEERPDPVALETVKSKTLMRAAALLGGIDRLATYLGVSRPDLFNWMAGHGEPPDATFLLAVDVVLEDSENNGIAC